MKLTRWHIATHVCLAAIAMLIGMLVSQFHTYQARLAEWRLAANKCSVIAENQKELLEKFFR